MWTSNKLQTHRRANKLMKHIWGWWGRWSAETPQTHCSVSCCWCAALGDQHQTQLLQGVPPGLENAVVAHMGFCCMRLSHPHWFSLACGWVCLCVALLAAVLMPSKNNPKSLVFFPWNLLLCLFWGCLWLHHRYLWAALLRQQPVVWGVLWAPLLPYLSFCQGIFPQHCLCQADWSQRYQLQRTSRLACHSLPSWVLYEVKHFFGGKKL